MSARSEPRPCCCRFCDEHFTAAGIKTHETHCDQNPRPGVHPRDAPDLFEETPDSDPDPDPTESDTEASLPPRETLADPDNQQPADHNECPACGSDDTIPALEARRHFAKQLGEVPEGLRSTLDATEKYCNECFSVSGGALDQPFCITEGFQ